MYHYTSAAWHNHENLYEQAHYKLVRNSVSCNIELLISFMIKFVLFAVQSTCMHVFFSSLN